MSQRPLAVCVQIDAGDNLEKNLQSVHSLIKKAIRSRPALIALPENFSWRGGSSGLKTVSKHYQRIVSDFKALSKKSNTAFLLGSLIEPAPGFSKFYNTSVLINASGKITAKYRKIHLFRIGLKGVRADETKHISRGNQPTLGRLAGMKCGLSICYDLRFPELYRSLTRRGARLFFIPANFTEVTGRAHWEVLLRARAIENQAFVIAPAQVGVSPSNGIRSFGTSLIVDPWGRVLARGSAAGEECVSAILDLPSQQRLRKEFPVLRHRVIGRPGGEF